MKKDGYLNESLSASPQSYWRESINLEEHAPAEKHMDVDVVIVGGGITGITSAYVLVNEGLRVALLEAGKLLNGTTGHTTAKITAQHGLIYDEFIGNIGKNDARLYYEANMEALKFIEKTVSDHSIDCDFKKEDAYIYAATEESKEKLKKEAEAYEKLHINGELADEMPLDIDMRQALVMKDQAQFHPTKYLKHLLEVITEKGGHIYEDTTAVNIEKGDWPSVLTREGHRVKGKHVLICSHFPFFEGMGLYSTRMHAERSYILAAKTKKDYPGGMYISADEPTRSLRSVNINGEEMVLIGGESHKTGQGKETSKHYNALEEFGEREFGLEDVAYRWSAQDLITLDKVPYIGEITPARPNILIGTGFRKWGMTNGTAAALLFRDIILEKSNAYKDLYTPSRFHADPSLRHFFTENSNVFAHLLKGKFDKPNKDTEELDNDEGAVITLNGHRKGAYKDENGEVFVVDTTCTHVGCEVEWNDGDRTWDCPCHGSRFSYKGEVIEGPAEKPLKTYDYRMLDNLTSEDSGY